MKLSDREIKMILNVPKHRQRRRQNASLGLVTALCALIAVNYFGIYRDALGPIAATLLGVAVGELASAYFRVRPEDKLIDLLLRYVNSDPEALRQFSVKAATIEKAA